jgi:tRNA modification GTPase
MTETIYALSTAPGRAGVAIVRVSGPGARASMAHLTGKKNVPPRQAVFTSLSHAGILIDRVVVVFFAAPASFTGEDVVEYHVHGSRAVIDSLLSALSAQPGHRLAEPGEFTRRAYLNGKMDLVEAEGLADLIHAETEAQKNQALAQMSGSLSKLYESWRESLIKSLAYVEAIIDFPDEDIPDSETAKAKPGIEKLLTDIREHLNDHRRGEMLRDGVRVVVIGAPNAGKSSLVNALARRDVAIVSDLAGTTRDIIDVHLNIGGYPVILSDTAGLRPEQIGERGHDKIESEGIRRALTRAQDADIKILLFDGTNAAPDPATLALRDEKSLIVVNKVDQPQKAIPARDISALSLSTQSGEGIPALLSALEQKIKTLMDAPRGTPSLTRARHREALEHTASLLTRALSAPSPELMAEELRLAARTLGRITGRVDVEDLLDVIFKDFCIGK